MTSGKAGGLENREPLKAGYKRRHLEVDFPLLPGPGIPELSIRHPP
jgi:hypothetical protein